MLKLRIKNLQTLILCIASIEIFGIVLGLISSADVSTWYNSLNKPLTLPPWIFGVTWTILYGLIGIVMYKLFTSKFSLSIKTVFALHLVLNFVWTPIFFFYHQLLISCLVIVAIDALVVFNIYQIHKYDTKTALLLIPYLVWLCIATYLNLGIFLLN